MHQSLSGSSLLLDKFCFLFFQVNEKEAIWISVGVFGFSAGISIPFIIFTKLQRMFYEPGAYDHIAFCVEDLSQQAQVGFSNIFQVFPIFSWFYHFSVTLKANVTFNLFMGGLEIAFVKARGALII